MMGPGMQVGYDDDDEDEDDDKKKDDDEDKDEDDDDEEDEDTLQTRSRAVCHPERPAVILSAAKDLPT
jgi:hypothetical protein